MQYQLVTTQEQLEQLCRACAGADFLAFDTEFVSEDRYRPDLCLIQVQTDGQRAVIDPLGQVDLSPFWQLLVEGDHETIVHAGREEFRFCLQATGRRPVRWFDVQLAAAFIGLEYPASYGSLISRLLGKTLEKGETRTNWRHRPLTERQLHYALQDVVYLKPMRDVLRERIEKLGRETWVVSEVEAWQDRIEEAESSEQWQRVSGVSGLPPRALAIYGDGAMRRPSGGIRRPNVSCEMT